MAGDQRLNLPTAHPQTSLLDYLSLANGSHRGSPELCIHRLPKSPPEGIVVRLLSSRQGAGIPPLQGPHADGSTHSFWDPSEAESLS